MKLWNITLNGESLGGGVGGWEGGWGKTNVWESGMCVMCVHVCDVHVCVCSHVKTAASYPPQHLLFAVGRPGDLVTCSDAPGHQVDIWRSGTVQLWGGSLNQRSIAKMAWCRPLSHCWTLSHGLRWWSAEIHVGKRPLSLCGFSANVPLLQMSTWNPGTSVCVWSTSWALPLH